LVADAASENPVAVGAVLLQEGHPVAFYSRKLSGPELNCSVSDIEMLEVISALREWRCYLEGVPFTIVTDHKPNTYLSDSANLRGTQVFEPSNTYTIHVILSVLDALAVLALSTQDSCTGQKQQPSNSDIRPASERIGYPARCKRAHCLMP
jgi:hypothetical protein